jgi:hypothetical protein
MNRYRVALLIGLIAICARSLAGEAKPELPAFANWLGPQENDKKPDWRTIGMVYPVAEKEGIRQRNDPELANHEISLTVVDGSRLQLPKSANSVVTFDGKSFQRKGHFPKQAGVKYLAGNISLKTELGCRIYKLNVRVTKGPLKGAIVHLWDHRVPDSIGDPYFSAFEVPREYGMVEGPVEFEIVSYFYK